jgi:phosphatidate cytidylyltransferase
MSELTKRIIVATFGIPLLIGVTFKGGWYFFVIIAIVSIVAQWEFYKIQEKKQIFTQNFSGILVGLLILLGIETGEWYLAGGLILIALMIILVAEMFRQNTNVSANVGVTLLGVFYIPFFLGSLLYLRSQADQLFPSDALAGFKFVMMIFVTIWICDTFAYSFGSKLGRHKLFEKVSPNKTVEGAIAGIIGSLLVLVSVKLAALLEINWFQAIIIGISIGIIGQIGDLVESCFKRDAGVKDTSALLPGHGGMLDRFDSIIFVSPAMLLLINLLFN